MSEIAECILCGQRGQLRHTADGSPIVRCPNVCITTLPQAGITDEQAINTWNRVNDAPGQPDGDGGRDGVCCDCGYDGQEETPCPKRDDRTHCVHWWDGDEEDGDGGVGAGKGASSSAGRGGSTPPAGTGCDDDRPAVPPTATPPEEPTPSQPDAPRPNRVNIWSEHGLLSLKYAQLSRVDVNARTVYPPSAAERRSLVERAVRAGMHEQIRRDNGSPESSIETLVARVLDSGEDATR